MQKLMIVLAMVVSSLALCSAAPREVVIFHTNDIHGHFTPEPASWRKDHALVGGVDALFDQLQKLRSLHPQSLYLDAGDLMTGNPICNIEYNGVKGGALPELLKRCGVDAECLGNHEFDQGADHLRKYISSAQYPILCANIIEKNGGKPLTAPSHIFNVAGLRIGVIGLILDNLSSVAAHTAVSLFRVEDAFTVAQKQIDALAPKTDLVVLLTHEGVDDDSVLAMHTHGAKIIVGGHSHTRLEKEKHVNGVVIVQAGSYLKDLGMLDVWVDGDSLISARDSLISLTVPEHTTTNPVSSLADSLAAAIQNHYGQKIGELAETWTKSYYTGSNVGNWICDRLRERYKADVAFVNAGGIRTDINAGPVTLLQIQELLPFVNSVVTFEATGAELRKAALEQARAQGLHKHGVLEISGMTIHFKKVGNQVQLTDVQIGGKPLSPQKKYRAVSIDYVAQSQWDEYLTFKPHDIQTTGELISDVIGEEIQKSPQPVHADSAPRIVEVQ